MFLKSYLFIKDEERTLANRTRRERTYLIGIIIYLVAIVFLILEITSMAIVCFILGSILIFTGKFILIYTPNKGAIPGEFIIDNNDVIILKNRYKIQELKELSFNLVTYEDGPSFNQFKKAEGNENEVSFRLNDKLLKMNFYIPTSRHYIDLIDYLEERKIKYQANKGFPWT